MAWSTRELAELVGTTVKTIRHYHRIGLLDEPDRTTNGYKQYGVDHLVRLLRVVRLTDLDLPLAQIAAMDRAETEPGDALRALDSELSANTERLHRVRAELSLILRNQSSTDLPAGFCPVQSEPSGADRALALIYSRVFGPSEMSDLREMLLDLWADPTQAIFDALPADADAASRADLAERYGPHLRTILSRYPWMRSPETRAERGSASAERTLAQAVSGLYNPAQRDVLDRVERMMRGDPTS